MLPALLEEAEMNVVTKESVLNTDVSYVFIVHWVWNMSSKQAQSQWSLGAKLFKIKGFIQWCHVHLDIKEDKMYICSLKENTQ